MSNVTLEPYLFFKGECKEAMQFYKGIFGGELIFSSYDDMPDEMPGKAEMKGMIMHASLKGGEVNLMASDTQAASPKAAKVDLAISGTDETKLRKMFSDLAEGGNIQQPLEKAPWGDIFGMLVDKYYIEWMFNIGDNMS